MNNKQEHINIQKLIKEGNNKFLKGLPGLMNPKPNLLPVKIFNKRNKNVRAKILNSFTSCTLNGSKTLLSKLNTLNNRFKI